MSVEGSVASTKSSFISHIQSQNDPDVAIVEEPVDQWLNVHGFNILGEGTTDCLESITNFQNLALSTVLNAPYKLNLENKKIVISERSVDTQRHVFWRALAAANKLKAATYATLQKIAYDFYDPKRLHDIDIVCYLKPSPENCNKRCLQRNRVEEERHTLRYFQNLLRLHEEWIYTTLPEMAWDTQVVVIDVDNKTPHDMEQEAIKFIHMLGDLVQKKY